MRVIVMLALFFLSITNAHSQSLGQKVRFKAEDGKTYTGMITYIDGPQYKIKYDNAELVRWAKKGEFEVITQYLMNSRVDAFKENGEAIGRGSVIQIVSGEKYKIRLDGCFEKNDVVVKVDNLKTAVNLEKDDSSLTGIFGKWQLLAYNYPKDFTGLVNNGTEPPLTIKQDGTYTWYDEYNKPSIIGNWYAYAKMEGVKEGPNSYNGVILTDKTNLFWKVYTGGDGNIPALRMCGTETRDGTPLR